MALNKLLLYKVLKSNKKLGLLFVGYNDAKYMLGLYETRKKGNRKLADKRKN